MGVGVSNGPFFTWSSVDHSDHIRSMSFPIAMDEVDMTGSGSQTHRIMAGLIDASLEIEFNDDEDATEISKLLWDDFISKTERVVVVRRETTAVGQANPSYTFTGLITRLPPINWGAGGGRIGTARIVLRSDIVKAIA